VHDAASRPPPASTAKRQSRSGVQRARNVCKVATSGGEKRIRLPSKPKRRAAGPLPTPTVHTSVRIRSRSGNRPGPTTTSMDTTTERLLRPSERGAFSLRTIPSAPQWTYSSWRSGRLCSAATVRAFSGNLGRRVLKLRVPDEIGARKLRLAFSFKQQRRWNDCSWDSGRKSSTTGPLSPAIEWIRSERHCDLGVSTRPGSRTRSWRRVRAQHVDKIQTSCSLRSPRSGVRPHFEDGMAEVSSPGGRSRLARSS